jgi:complement component 1 Q subcomponent-binding protein, mitochondrial
LFFLKQLYDILLNLLEERGIGEDFASDLAEFSTSYEHLQYVSLLEKLKDFSQ